MKKKKKPNNNKDEKYCLAGGTGPACPPVDDDLHANREVRVHRRLMDEDHNKALMFTNCYKVLVLRH